VHRAFDNCRLQGDRSHLISIFTAFFTVTLLSLSTGT
jgi:hypothetical protein